MGLLGMRERAALIGATVDIIGSLGEGTEVTVRLPLGRQGPTKDVTTQRRNGETSASGR
jgi:signal transduction histidine kinase